MRISARLDPDRARKLESLAAATTQSKSEILKTAIDLYYEAVITSRPRPAEIFRRTGFVGSGKGPSGLSEDYKDEMAEGLAAKHGHR